jgi:hypothetical protein
VIGLQPLVVKILSVAASADFVGHILQL